MIHENIKQEVRTAMLEKDQVKLAVVRGLLAAFTNEVIAKKRKPDEFLTDEEALAVIQREAKKRKDSIEQFSAAGRPDLVDQETAEFAYLQKYLPAMMPREEIRDLAVKKRDEFGITDKSKAGQLMAALMKELKGKADGTDVKTVVDEIWQ